METTNSKSAKVSKRQKERGAGNFFFLWESAININT